MYIVSLVGILNFVIMLITTLGFGYNKDLGDIPIVIRYWATSPASANWTKDNLMEENVSYNVTWRLMAPAISHAISAFIIILIVYTETYYDTEKDTTQKGKGPAKLLPGGPVRALCFIDELVVSFFVTTNLAILIGMNDYAAIAGIAINSLIPPFLTLIAEDRMHHKNIVTGLQWNGKHIVLTMWVYLYPVLISLVFSVIPFIPILIIHHLARGVVRPMTHVAVYMTLSLLVAWRAAFYFTHMAKRTRTMLTWERAIALCVVISISQVQYWSFV